MNDARLKIGLVVAFLFAMGSALFWNDLYQGAREQLRGREASDAVMVVVHGGDLPARAVSPAGSDERRPRRTSPARERERPPVRERSRPVETRTFTVSRGDSLYDIAVGACGDPSLWPEIARLNDIPEPYRIHPGQILRLPSPTR